MKPTIPYLAFMKPIVLLFLVLFSAKVQAIKRLKAGTYIGLKSVENIVLDTGRFTFTGLEMKNPGNNPVIYGYRLQPWLDATRASEVRFENCSFLEVDAGVVLKLAGNATLINCRIVGIDWERETLRKEKKYRNRSRTGIEYHQGMGLNITQSTLQNLNYGLVFYGSKSSGTRTNLITENNFVNNEQNLRFKSSYQANHKLTLKCNKFTTPTSPGPFTMRYGIFVEEGAEMPDIGGTGLNGQIPPAANQWPVAGTIDQGNPNANPPIPPNWPLTLNSGLGIDGWYSPTGWETVHNLTNEFWNYFRYKNEYLGPFSNPPGSIVYFDATVVNRMVRPRDDQVIPTGELSDDACPNFHQVLVFPTRPASNQDSILSYLEKVQKQDESFLDQNIPNPATNSTSIGYRLPAEVKAAKLELFEISSGRIVKSMGIPVSGRGMVELGLHGLPNEIYGYRLLCDSKPMEWKKMVIAR